MSDMSAKVGVQISGTIEYRDKDGNLIKAVPFSGHAPLETEESKEEDGDLRE